MAHGFRGCSPCTYRGKLWNADWRFLENRTKIHRTALIESWVKFDDDCLVHPYAIIGRHPDRSKALARNVSSTSFLTIGKNSIIGCHAIIYSDVILGNDCLVGDNANIREGSRIGNECVIGTNVSISYNVRIGNRCRFQNGCVIVGDIWIDDECFFGINVTTSNDRKVDLENYHFPMPPQPSCFGKKVMVGSGSNILAGCKIGNGVTIAAGSLIVKDVEDNKIMMNKSALEYVR